jgi:cytochrome c-type biogenesis protein CcmH/NrfG
MVKQIDIKKLFAGRRGILLAVGVVVLIIVTAGISYWIYDSRQPAKVESPADSATVLKEVTTGQLPLNNEETKAKLESSLESADDKGKYRTYLLLANEYTAAKEYGKAAEAYRKAESLGGLTSDLAFSTAVAYEKNGDKNNALSYYKKTREILGGDDGNGGQGMSTSAFLKEVNAKIEGLEG